MKIKFLLTALFMALVFSIYVLVSGAEELKAIKLLAPQMSVDWDFVSRPSCLRTVDQSSPETRA